MHPTQKKSLGDVGKIFTAHFVRKNGPKKKENEVDRTDFTGSFPAELVVHLFPKTYDEVGLKQCCISVYYP